MSAELVLVNLFKIGFVVVAIHLSLTKIIPFLQEILDPYFNNNKAVDALTSLIGILVIIVGGLKIMDFLAASESAILGYLTVIQPGLETIFALEYYFRWLIMGVVAIVAVKAFKGRK